MKKIDIYYTNLGNKYGFVIEERNGAGARNKKNKLLAFGNGETSDPDTAMLKALHDSLLMIKELKEKEVIKEEAIHFFNVGYNTFRYVNRKKVSIDNIDIKKEQKNILKDVFLINKDIGEQNKISHTRIGDNANDGVSLLKFDMIKYCIKNGIINDIENAYKKSQKEKLIDIKNNDGTEIKVEICPTKKEINKKLKNEKRKIEQAKRKAYRQSDDYKNFISSLIDNEMANDKVLRTSQLTIQQEYNLEKITNLIVYTDGSISNGKVEGTFVQGYGVSILDNETNKPLFKFKGKFTDNSHELQHIEIVESYAIYRALFFIDKKMQNGEIDKNAKITIKTDSQSAIDNLEKYKKGNTNILGINIIKEIDRLTSNKNFKIDWVKGHSTNVNNKEVDKLARQSLKEKTADEYVVLNSINKEIENTNNIKQESTQEINKITPDNVWSVYLNEHETKTGFVLKRGDNIIEAGKFDVEVNNKELKGVSVIEAFRSMSKHIEKEMCMDPIVKVYFNNNKYIDYILANKKDDQISKESAFIDMLDITKEERHNISKKYNLKVSKNSIKGHEQVLKEMKNILKDPSIPDRSIYNSLNLSNEKNETYNHYLERAIERAGEVNTHNNVIDFNKVVEEMNELMEDTKHIQPSIKRLSM